MVTIWTTRRGQSPHPAYSDTYMSEAITAMLLHYMSELASKQLAEVRVVCDGKSRAESDRAAAEEARAADASEAYLRAAGG